MPTLKIQKVVAALPTTLAADAIYLVRVGTGFDMYVTNSIGVVVAYAMNQSAGGGVQIGGADAAQTPIVSLDGGAPVQPNDVAATGGTPASAGV